MINCTLNHVPDIGYGPIEGDSKKARLWEYGSKDIHGNEIDVTHRNTVARILRDEDRDIIEKYMDYHYVLGDDFKMSL